jgi:hypothetical protein
MNWVRILAYVTGTVDQKRWREQYLAAETILKAQLKGRLRFLTPTSYVRRNRSSTGPQGSRRSGHRGPADTILPGTGSSSPANSMAEAVEARQASDQASGRAADRTHGQGEP